MQGATVARSHVVSRTAANSAGRVGRAWREVSARVYREEQACWLCGGWVDPSLHPRDRMARTADHLVQLQHGGRPTDRTNLRLCHMRCNTARSNRLRGLTIDQCACSVGLPCARLEPDRRRGYVAMSLDEV
jgi:5-methylcytosine-specific restriction endonuclease McrA